MEIRSCQYCSHKRPAGGTSRVTLVCENFYPKLGQLWVVDYRQCCENFSPIEHDFSQGAVIPLTKGKYALIDVEDYERVSQYSWSFKDNIRTCYAVGRVNGEDFRMHRFILSSPLDRIVDHINHNGLDNRKQNIRNCSHVQNSANSRSTLGSTSKYRGVCYVSAKKCFTAYITKNGKRYHLGTFKSEKEAAKAYDKKAIELFGQFACLNLPEVKVKLKPAGVVEKKVPPKV